MGINWKKGEKALVDVPSPLPAFTDGWDDWADQVRQVHLQEVVVGEPHWYETTYGYYVGGNGVQGVWVPKAWLSRCPWAGGNYCEACGGLEKHKLGCPTTRPVKNEDY